jgi:uncharacterized protein YijF (DUF1287 family)
MKRRHLIFGAAFLSSGRAFAAPLTSAEKLIAAARAQIGVTVVYDPAYVKLAYPGGDVSRDRGVCTDVVIRAYRDGLDVDLQKLLHEDMAKSFATYPKTWGLKRTDWNIDHRRVPNLQRFFARQKAARTDLGIFQPGDLVTMMLPGNLPHIGIVSDQKDGDRPLFIHNIGAGTQEEDMLGKYPITGRYRFGI